MVGQVICYRCLLTWRSGVSRIRNSVCLGTTTLRSKYLGCGANDRFLSWFDCIATVLASVIIYTSSTSPRVIFSHWKPSRLIPRYSTTVRTPRGTRRTTLERGKE